jgi:hypothetical protein
LHWNAPAVTPICLRSRHDRYDHLPAAGGLGTARHLAEEISGPDYFGAARNSALDIFMDHVDSADPLRKDRLIDKICAA